METPAALAFPTTTLRLSGRVDIDPLIGLIVAALLLAGIAAAAVVTTSGMILEKGPFAQFLILAGAMIALSRWSVYRKLDARISDAAKIVAAGIVALITCGIISNVGLRLGAQPIDSLLVRADALAGIDVAGAVRAFTRYPAALDALTWIYTASGAAVVVLIFTTLARGDRRTTWELVATIVLSMQVVALLSVAAPAVGAMVHLKLLDLQGTALPAGAGVYHLEAFARFHAGSDPIVRLSEMSGLVTFPSFHTVLALMATQALAHTRWRFIGIAFTAAVIVSTIPIGGHYVTDLAAGFAIWAGCVWLVRRVNTPSA